VKTTTTKQKTIHLLHDIDYGYTWAIQDAYGRMNYCQSNRNDIKFFKTRDGAIKNVTSFYAGFHYDLNFVDGSY